LFELPKGLELIAYSCSVRRRGKKRAKMLNYFLKASE
jgi:hypothetical protein